MSFIKYIAAIYIFTISAAMAQTPIADNAFRKCIADSIPTALDANQNLILTKAAAVKKLECPNYGIATIDELKYFTGLTELNITKNPIITLPDIAAMTGLTKLNIGETKLTTIPDLSPFINLQYLSIHRLDVTQFPDLTNNKNLIQLLVHTNKFDNIPALNLPKLEYLGISLVGITALPDLTNLPKLRKLECFRNKIKQLPDLSGMDSLKVLDASSNFIEEFPTLPLGIQTVYLDSNLISELPSLTSYQSLTKVRLFKNYLNFQDLLPLTAFLNYPSLFELSPQKVFNVGTMQTIVELEKFSLDSKIDSNTSGVSRKWIFNNNVTGQTSRIFSIDKARPSDKGNYYCEVTHPSFPNLKLRTDAFNVDVLPCVNISGVIYDITGNTCVKQGSVNISLINQPGINYKFDIEGLQTHTKYSSASGQFAKLEDLEYKLTISAPNGCSYTIPNTIEIPREDCKQLVITPNGDGVDDNYYFSQTGNAKVVDKFGNTICQLTLPKLWDGYVNDHRVPAGYYLININSGEEVLKMSVIY
ncbi:MAG: leucine-rich repeat domain-containing protein [Sporocytophaga sp.]|uniref:leucine-rich repeat domain-containing protein n=1 Tax=Sporocytophaga sp. TaxID=2231183 RepID=UPI001B149C88|nr:leucine-rich repeat domain-containing protein [Sporocytophaga sp.]MBO9702831.1 leucine-rich repeat domain-containing protein [Sporocytophaga sp.]